MLKLTADALKLMWDTGILENIILDIRKGMTVGIDFIALKFSKAYKNSADKGKYSNITLTLTESIYVDG